MIERRATRVKVDHHIGARQQFGLDVMRDHLRRLAVTRAGKQAIEIAAIDRRSARAIHERREIQGRNHDQTAANGQFRHALHQLHQCDGAFVFVAMIAAGEQHGRAIVACVQNGERNGNMAVGGTIMRPRQPQRAGLETVAFEVDFSGDERGESGHDLRGIEWVRFHYRSRKKP
jgi:hypothetical protein